MDFEQDILQAIQQSMKDAMKTALTGYNSPLTKMITDTVNRHDMKLRSILDRAFVEVISTQEFADSIKAAFAHKVGRVMISNHESLFEKVANDLKQDKVYRAKMQVALSQATDEYLASR